MNPASQAAWMTIFPILNDEREKSQRIGGGGLNQPVNN